MIRRTILVLILSLFVVVNLNAKLVLIAPSSVSSSNNFYLKIDFESDSGEAEDLYVLFSLYGQLYSFTQDGNIVAGIKKYATTAEIEKTIFKYPFSSVQFDTTIPFIAASLNAGTEARVENIREMVKKEVLFRKSFPRNTAYLEDYLQNMQSNDKYKDYLYSAYASRTILVRHPELYLQADAMLFEKYMQDWGYSFPELLHPFSNYVHPLRDANYDSKKFAEIYSRKWDDKRIPLFDLFDRKILAGYFYAKLGYSYGKNNISIGIIGADDAGAVKKNYDLTEDEKAFLVYFYKKFQDKAQDVFVILSLSGNAYVYADGLFYNTKGEQISKEKVDLPVLLIMNENYVWYPLMARDDTDKSAALKDVIEILRISKDNSNIYKLLDNFEQKWIDFFRNPNNDIQAEVLNKNNDNIVYVQFRKLFLNDIEGIRQNMQQRRFDYTHHVRILANMLSVYADYFANIYTSTIGTESKKYIAASTEMYNIIPYSNNFVGTFLESPTTGSRVFAYTADVGYRAGAGVCEDIASYSAAFADIIGKKWYFVVYTTQDKKFSGHAYLYIPENNVYFDDGIYFGFNDVPYKWVAADGSRGIYNSILSPYFPPKDGVYFLDVYGKDAKFEHNGYYLFEYTTSNNVEIKDVIGTLVTWGEKTEEGDLTDLYNAKDILEHLLAEAPSGIRFSYFDVAGIKLMNGDEALEALDKYIQDYKKYLFYEF